MAANDNACTHDANNLLDEDPSEIFIESLPFASQFAIWAARAWVTALKVEQPFETVSGDTFRKLDMLPAQQALDSLFRIIAGSASRPIDIRCLKCRQVSPDEMIFHQAVSAAQGDQAFVAYQELRAWMPPAAARIGFNSLVTFATLLGKANLRLAPRKSATETGMGISVAAREDDPMQHRDMPSIALH